VIVDFLEGDPDRPIITGCVYNASTMPPYDLPDNQTQSGLRSRSTPGGSMVNGNELRFEDALGNEDLYIQAERTQTTLVKSDQSITVGGNRVRSVGGSETVNVGGGRTTTITLADTTNVLGASTLSVTGARTEQVTGDATDTVTGDVSETFGGSLSVSVSGNETVQVSGDLSQQVTGRVDLSTVGPHTDTFGDDFVARHAGDRVVVVGGADAPASASLHVEGSGTIYAAQTIDAVAIESITITCGDSVITIAPDGVTIASPAITLVTKDAEIDSDTLTVSSTGAVTLGGDKVTLSSSGASVALDSNATVQGAKVQLKGGSGSSAQNDNKSKTTTITLVDADGKPLANQRVILREGGDGGDEQTIVLDDKGSATVTGDGPFDVVMPDLPDAKAS
jgi:type VI secretion system secreted protein VgrG